MASAASLIAVRGVCSAGLDQAEQPAASAGASFQAAISSGKFQGSTSPTTPAGSLTISASVCSPVGATLPKVLSISSAYHWKKFATSLPISCRQSLMVLPESMLSRTASSSLCSRTRSASFSSTALRSSGADRLQPPASNAPRAARTAASTSSAMQCATSAIGWPVAGLIVVKVAPAFAGTYSPPMNARVSGFTAAAMLSARSRVIADIMWLPMFPLWTTACRRPARRC